MLSFNPPGGPSRWLAASDLDGDGKVDLVSVSTSNSSLTVTVGNGNGTFQLLQSFGSVSNDTFVTMGDVNNDGKSNERKIKSSGFNTIEFFKL